MGSRRCIQGEFSPKDTIPAAHLTSGRKRPLHSLVRLKTAYEHVYGIRLDEREAEEHVRRKAAIQQHLRAFPVRYACGLIYHA